MLQLCSRLLGGWVCSSGMRSQQARQGLLFLEGIFNHNIPGEYLKAIIYFRTIHINTFAVIDCCKLYEAVFLFETQR